MFFARYTLAAQNMGLWGAYKVFVRSRWSRRVQSVRIRGIGRFWFRGGMDFGVMSHFYNIGGETRRFAYFHPKATIVAIEPELKNFDMLLRNVRPPHVTVRAGLWPRQAKLAVLPGDTPEGCSVIEDGRALCPAITVPQLLEETGWDEINILKLDIEGAEFEVFSDGAEAWVGRVNCFIFECPDPARPTTTARIFAKLPSQNYRTEICGESLVVMKADLPLRLQPQTLL